MVPITTLRVVPIQRYRHITLETAMTIYVMELKLNGSVEDALAQIEVKHYADAFKMQSKPVVKVGMNFMLKDGVNILEWKVL